MRQTFDGAAFGRMICSAAASIELKKQKINELNVFPVPDGDTGTNMSMTLGAAATELRRKPDVTLTKAADVAASALLRGARGNSGVILSLLFRGFSKALKGMEQADGRDFAAALTTGVEAAYKAVMKPAEGTILTVSRLTADAARDLADRGSRHRIRPRRRYPCGEGRAGQYRQPESRAEKGRRRRRGRHGLRGYPRGHAQQPSGQRHRRGRVRRRKRAGRLCRVRF